MNKKTNNKNQKNILEINANYFDKSGIPSMMIRRKNKIISPKKEVLSGFFWCKDGNCTKEFTNEPKFQSTK